MLTLYPYIHLDLITPQPPISTLFPYTTLFRSQRPADRSRLHHFGRATAAAFPGTAVARPKRSEEHTSELQSRQKLVCRLLLEKKKQSAEIRRAYICNYKSLK